MVGGGGQVPVTGHLEFLGTRIRDPGMPHPSAGKPNTFGHGSLGAPQMFKRSNWAVFGGGPKGADLLVLVGRWIGLLEASYLCSTMKRIPKRTTVTAALPYANGPIHIGHLAGCYLPADIYVRYLRMRGRDVAFICGSDEHGMAITVKARKEGTTPQAVVDTYHAVMGKAFRDFGISFDIYSRTSSDLHRDVAQGFFKNLYD